MIYINLKKMHSNDVIIKGKSLLNVKEKKDKIKKENTQLTILHFLENINKKLEKNLVKF